MNIAIIGVSGAIGSALLEHYLANGKTTEIFAFSRTPIEHPDERVNAVSLDLTDQKSIEKAAARIFSQSLDLVIAATGMLHDKSEGQLQPEKTLKQLSAENMAEVFAVNTIGPALLLKYFLPLLKRDSKSVFVALSARVGSISDNRLGGWYSYRASKAALNMLIKTAAIEYNRLNKQAVIAGLHPGTVDSGLSKPFQARVQEGKLFSPKKSAAHLVSVLENLKKKDSGKCFAWDGQEIPA